MNTVLIIVGILILSYVVYTAGYIDGCTEAVETCQKVLDEILEEIGKDQENENKRDSAED